MTMTKKSTHGGARPGAGRPHRKMILRSGEALVSRTVNGQGFRVDRVTVTVHPDGRSAELTIADTGETLVISLNVAKG